MVSPSLSCSTVFFNSPARSMYLSFFSFSFSFTLWSAGTAKATIRQVLLFLLMIIRSGGVAEIRWSVYISKSQRSLCISFSRTDSWLCIYHLFVRSNFNFLQTKNKAKMIKVYMFLLLLTVFLKMRLTNNNNNDNSNNYGTWKWKWRWYQL